MSLGFDNVQYNNNISSNPTSSNLQSSSVQNTSGQSSTPINMVPDEKKYLELCKSLGITIDELRIICSATPNFLALSLDEQKQYIQNRPVGQPTITPKAEIPASENAETVPELPAKEVILMEATEFDHQAYQEMSLDEKAKLYAQEVAKNKFLLGGTDGETRTIEEWNALSDEQKYKLIENQVKALKNEDLRGLFKEEEVHKLLEEKMTTLQAANYNGKSLQEFNNKPEGMNQPEFNAQKVAAINDYLFDVCEPTEIQHEMLQKSAEFNDGVLEILKEKVEQDPKLKEKYGELLADENLQFNEKHVVQALKDMKMTPLHATRDILKKKIDNNKASEEEVELFEFYENIVGENGVGKKLVKLAQSDNAPNYGRMEAFNNSEYGKLYNTATADNESKVLILKSYVDKEFADLSPQDRAKAVSQLMEELVGGEPNNIELAIRLYGTVTRNSTEEQKIALAKEVGDIQVELNAINAQELGDEAGRVYAETLHNAHCDCKNAEERQHLANCANVTIKNMSESQRVNSAQVFTVFDDETVQTGYASIALDSEQTKDVENQRVMLEAVSANSMQSVRINTAQNLHKAYSENQVPLVETFSQDKDVAVAMNEAKNLDKYAVENQTAVFDVMKNRFEQDDFEKDEAIVQLNSLSDQIQNCDVSNQLGMHKSIMSSKYTEVQEHAAGNIVNYDSSVQQAAMDTVYETGNQKAIENAVNNMAEYKSPDVQSQELIRVVCENALANSSDMQLAKNADNEDNVSKIFSGKFSLQEASKLPVSERREYFLKYFRQLPIEEKIKLITSVTSLSQKKTIYKMVALSDPTLFTMIISDADRAQEIKEMNIQGVSDKVDIMISRKKYSSNEFKELAEKYENPDKHMSIPKDLTQNPLKKGQKFEMKA